MTVRSSSGLLRFRPRNVWLNWNRGSSSSIHYAWNVKPSFRKILERLNEHHVEYIVVGGVAAVIRGAPVTTFDLDALVRINEENADRLVNALEALDARYREHHTIIKPTRNDILAGGHLLLMTHAGPLDILGFIGEHERYEDLIEASGEVSMTVGRFRVLNLDELIRQKKATDRSKDRAVLEILEEALRRQKRDD